MSTFSNAFKVPFVHQFKSSELIKNPHAIAFIAVALLATIALTITVSKEQSSVVSNAQIATESALYVSPSGLDTNDGASPFTPLQTIQAALNKATPGTTINLAEGVYREKPTTKIHGTVDAPITIKGPELGKDKTGRYKAVLHGTGRIFNIDHSYYVLDGFTIDGNEKLKDKTYPTTLSAVESFKDANQADTVDSKLIYIGSADSTRDLTGIKITNMFLHGAGTECVRIRNNAQNNIVENSVIEWCGMYAGGSSDQYKYHNGEGVYIGTSPKSTSQPMYANDGSSFNIIRNNTIYTFGSECLEVKENAHDNTFENNDCRYNDEPYSELGSNIELRGYNNKIIGNTIMGSRSVGLKMKSDSTSYTQGGNSAQNNNFSEIANESIRNDQSTAQGLFCGNTFTGTVLVGNSVGSPTSPCPTPTRTPTSAPTAEPPTASPLPTNTPAPTQPAQTYTFNPIADSYVNSNSSGTNYGTRTTMVVDSSPTNISYLKFDLTPLAGKTIVSATLRVRTGSDGSSNTHRVKSVSSTSWTETGIKYSNRPSLGSTIATISSGGRTNTWQQVAITSTAAANVGRIFSLGIDSSGSDSISFSTRESTYKPELVIQIQ